MKPEYDSATIVIPTYNRSELICQTLHALTKVAQIHRHQVIVADDGSSDDTEGVVRGFENVLDVCYCFQEDLGFRAAKARNSALRRARHPLLIFLDSGMLVTSWFVDAHLRAHRECPRAAAVIGYTYGFDRNNEGADALKQALDVTDIDATVRRIGVVRQFLDPREELYRRAGDDLNVLDAPWTLMWSCNFSLELDVFRMLGGFNEGFTTWGGEDTDLAYRLHRCGTRFVLERLAAAIHAPHEKHGETLQPTSVANFERETRVFHDPVISMLRQYGDIGLNERFLEERLLRAHQTERMSRGIPSSDSGAVQSGLGVRSGA